MTSRTSTGRCPSAAPPSRGRSPTSDSDGPCYLTRTTTDPAEAERWFEQFEGAGLDGVVAKPLTAPYTQNGRTMLKIKHARTADVVVAGYREHKNSTPERPLLGSLLLGLYTDGGLQHVGRRGVVHRGAAGRADRGAAAARGARSRTTRGVAGRSSSPPTRTGCRAPRAGGARARTCRSPRSGPSGSLEVGYEHMEGRRFRHTAQFKRWRTDRDPESCGYEQLEEPVSYDLGEVLSGSPKD